MQENSKKGFTLVETLVTVIIVLLLTMILTELTSLASKYFTSTVKDADAQMLCSTLTNAIEDELRYAENIFYGEKDGKTVFTYFSKNSGIGREAKITVKSQDDKNILVISGPNSSEYPLINTGSYVYDLGVGSEDNPFNISYADGVINVTLPIVDSTGKVICENKFTVIPLNPGFVN